MNPSTGSPLPEVIQAPPAKARPARKRFPTLRMFLRDPKAIAGLTIFGVFLLIALLAPWIATHDPHAYDGRPWEPPGPDHWLGTTDQGQDVYSQWVWGTRTSIFVGLGAGFVSTVIAVLIGMLGGYKGGWVDGVLNWITNIVLVLPGFPLILVIASYVPQSGPFTIMWVLGLTGWAWGARTKRAQALTFANRDFVLAAKLSGASDLWVLCVEILPNMLSYVFNNFIWATLAGIVGEAYLEFIGIGSPMIPSWGNMLNWAQH
ncbi:MAG: ABC transporter permease, partial [Alicyclobacillus sp.]|nr:ABC transporter permease [Alicyclobacillus sp.]